MTKLPLEIGNRTKITARGWICPFCNTAYAPWVEGCRCSTNLTNGSGEYISNDYKFTPRSNNEYDKGRTTW